MTGGDFTFTRNGRNSATLVALIAVWFGIFAAIFFLGAAIWLMAILVLFTAPALYDLIANRSAGMTLTDVAMHWHSGPHTGEIGWDQIDHVRLDTRLDFSVRVSAALPAGRRCRIPFEAAPPHQELEAALQARGIAVQRHHFSLL